MIFARTAKNIVWVYTQFLYYQQPRERELLEGSEGKLSSGRKAGSKADCSVKISDRFRGSLIHFQHHSYVFDYHISCHALGGCWLNFVCFQTPVLPAGWKSLPLICNSGSTLNWFYLGKLLLAVTACNFHCLAVIRKTTFGSGAEKENTHFQEFLYSFH